MIPFHNAMSIASESGRTYADFVVWASTQIALDVSPTSQAVGTTVSKRTVLNSIYSGTMWGSPSVAGGGYFTHDSALNRVAQHSFLNIEAAEANKGRMILISTNNSGSWEEYIAVNRNGYLSQPYSVFDSAYCISMTYFDDASGKIIKVVPYNNTFTVIDF